MSLVVCSNMIDENDYDENNINNAPYRFHNSLKQTFKIPPNSEVSVQSVKINKSSTYYLSRNDKWYEFWGPELLTSKTDEEKTIYQPIVCFPKLLEDMDDELVGMNDFIERISTAMNVGVPHPDFYGQITLGLNQDPTTKEMKGYKLSVQNPTALATEQVYQADFNKVANWHPIWDGMDANEKLTFTPGVSATPTFPRISRNAADKDDSSENTLECRSLPLSHARGELVVDVKGSYDAGGGEGMSNTWQIGLTREIDRDATLNTGNNEMGNPENFNGNLSTGFISQTDAPKIDFGSFSYEIVVTCEPLTLGTNNKLKIHHMTSNEDLTNDDGSVAMQEIDYYSWTGSPTFLAGDRYDLTTNTHKLSKIKYLLENEIVSVVVTLDDSAGDGSDTAADVTICSYTQTSNPNCTKAHYPIPMGQLQWNLYPRFILNGIADGSTARYFEIESYLSKHNTFNNYAFNNPDNSWETRLMREQEYPDLMILNRRVQYQFRGDGLNDKYVYQGLTYDAAPATKIIGWYTTDTADVRNWQCIMAPATLYYGNTLGSNLSQRLGFEDDPILEASYNGVTDADLLTQFISSTLPSAHQTKSLFVRLDNMTQQSVNAGVGRPSKILYHLPRFDDSGRDHGTGLFFEPPQRTYLKLHNSDALYLNELQLSIANDDEKLAKDLVGKTIICLHFQDSS